MAKPKIMLFKAFGEIYGDRRNKQGLSEEGLLSQLSKQMDFLFVGIDTDRNYVQPCILINSRGGETEEALRVYGYLSQLPQKLITLGLGLVDSAAIWVYLAGEKRLSTPTTLYYIHGGTYSIVNCPHDEVASVVKRYHVQVKTEIKILQERTRVNLRMARQWFSEGVTLNAKEAKKYGIVHEIVNKFPFEKENVTHADLHRTW